MVAGWRFVKVWLWLATRVLSNVVMLPDVVVVPYSTWLSAGLFVCQETTTELVDIEPVEIAEAERTHPEISADAAPSTRLEYITDDDWVVSEAFGQSLKCVAGLVANINRQRIAARNSSVLDFVT